MVRHAIAVAILVALVAGCTGAPATAPVPTPTEQSSSSPTTRANPLRYVALGDSYTIGTGLPRQVDRWPNQLVRALRPELQLRLADNVAVQWHSSFEVLDDQLPVLEELRPDLVSLLVGVNDVVVDVSDEEYRANVEAILDGRDGSPGAPEVSGLLDLVPADRVVLVTTPDYTLAPDPRYQRPGDAAAIDRFNAILRELAAARGVAVVDIAPISDLVPQDPTLVADDGLHPSAKQYAGWVELIAPVVRRLVEGA